jgi:NAD(P)-dependent dehydrogenase (short-subunit alcohol dehydrogenase family)
LREEEESAMKIFITGANRGLGLELARVGAKRGHTIVAGVRNKSEGLAQLQEENPDAIFVYPLEVTDEASVSAAAVKVNEDFESIDVIINNAAILLDREKTIEELDFEELQQTINVNLYGPMRVVKHFLPLLYNGENQSIVNISSEAGSFENAYGGDYPYAISKSALNMFTVRLKQYVNGKNIGVYSIHPGWIKTDMGGQNAPGSPSESANGIFDIIEGKIKPQSDYSFTDFQGNPMPI